MNNIVGSENPIEKAARIFGGEFNSLQVRDASRTFRHIKRDDRCDLKRSLYKINIKKPCLVSKGCANIIKNVTDQVFDEIFQVVSISETENRISWKRTSRKVKRSSYKTKVKEEADNKATKKKKEETEDMVLDSVEESVGNISHFRKRHMFFDMRARQNSNGADIVRHDNEKDNGVVLYFRNGKLEFR